jgi:hypothetical protein
VSPLRGFQIEILKRWNDRKYVFAAMLPLLSKLRKVLQQKGLLKPPASAAKVHREAGFLKTLSDNYLSEQSKYKVNRSLSIH